MIIDAVLTALAYVLDGIMTYLPFLPVWILAEFLAYTIEFMSWFISAVHPLTYYVPIGLAVKLGIARIEFETGMIVWVFVRWVLGHLPFIGGGE